jgi:hypothetical protein
VPFELCQAGWPHQPLSIPPSSGIFLFSESLIAVQLVLNLLVAEEKYEKPFNALLWQNRPIKAKKIERNQFMLLGIYKTAESLDFIFKFNIHGSVQRRINQ